MSWQTKRLVKRVESVVENRLILVGEYVRSQVSLLTPVQTGNLRDSYCWVTSKKRGNVAAMAKFGNTLIAPPELTVKVGTNVDYAIDVEKGTPPHKIRVKRAKVLTDGKTFFGKEVNHPGTTGKAPLMTGFKASKQAILRLLDLQK